MSFFSQLTGALDKPGFNWKLLIAGFSSAEFAFEAYLSYRQIKKLQEKGHQVPQSLKGKIEEDVALKSQDYSFTKLKFGIFSDAVNLLYNLTWIKFDILPKLWNLSGNILANSLAFLPWKGTLVQSLVFVNLLSIAGLVVSLPLSYYSTFVIEERFGFNKQTLKLWITDAIKGLLLSFVFGTAIYAGFLKIVDYFSDTFMFYMSVFMFVIQIFFIIFYPKFIQPLFNKLTPLEDGELKQSIEKLAADQKFPLDKLYVIDGSKRSSHSNAYFLGLPWGTKQIVIFDTLIEKSSVNEVTAVLGHEIGHWALSHTTKLLLINQVQLFSIFSLFALFFKNKSLYQSFGFSGQPVIIGFTLFSDVLKPFNAVLSFATNLLSRNYEYQADEYAVDLGYSSDLSSALIGLHKENLSSLHVDWLYSAYSHSHPHLTERLQAIEFNAKKEK
ncbi:BA75_02040T0 [Komagataella pastoris]|uniref:CAAX prenyl protease n=1 Tax=Komagataella pastoris TaxID=4922 RepID=A0A1B2JE11_PICPA|nr:BA75_02040T0 [Komagataella pastoris]